MKKIKSNISLSYITDKYSVYSNVATEVIALPFLPQGLQSKHYIFNIYIPVYSYSESVCDHCKIATLVLCMAAVSREGSRLCTLVHLGRKTMSAGKFPILVELAKKSGFGNSL